MMDSSPGTHAGSQTRGAEQQQQQLPATAGVKRPAPSLLPAFEPLFSSSPGLLPRPSKRHARAGSVSSSYAKYPTPVPTSSTGILSSSPPRVAVSAAAAAAARAVSGCGAVDGASARPALRRTLSVVSERAPLSAVPSIELNENGETLLMGRSSSSSHYQLSANRLISRVHVKARYVPDGARVDIVCNGWNGLTLHCQGRAWDLARGDTFSSEADGAEIMLDVHDARVLLRWPARTAANNSNATSRNESPVDSSPWDDSPRSRAGGAPLLQSSPLRQSARVIASPESPTPAPTVRPGSVSAPSLLPDDSFDETALSGAPIHIYEDASDDGEKEPELPPQQPEPPQQEQVPPAAGASFATDATNGFSSDLSDLPSDGENDPDEENDPIVHSFGPFGANLSNRLASFSTVSPTKTRSPAGSRRRRLSAGGAGDSGARLAAVLSASPGAGSKPTSPKTASPSHSINKAIDTAAITNHLINQLAFSRLSSSPLSTIMNNLPAEERKGGLLTPDDLRCIIEATACVGVIPRQGKDAAGRPLESEYYYIPEMDVDGSRRAAVVDGLRKPSLRNCRKQHKVCPICPVSLARVCPAMLTNCCWQQYYWKRPRTP